METWLWCLCNVFVCLVSSNWWHCLVFVFPTKIWYTSLGCDFGLQTCTSPKHMQLLNTSFLKCKKDQKGWKGSSRSSRSSHTLPSTTGLHTWQPRLSYIPLGQRTALAALRQCWSRCLGEWLARVVEIPIAKIQRAPIQVCVFCQMPNGSTFYAAEKQKSNVKGPCHV